MVMGMCALPASLIAGLLWESYGPIVPYALSFTLTVLAGIILLFVKTPECEIIKGERKGVDTKNFKPIQKKVLAFSLVKNFSW